MVEESVGRHAKATPVGSPSDVPTPKPCAPVARGRGLLLSQMPGWLVLFRSTNRAQPTRFQPMSI